MDSVNCPNCGECIVFDFCDGDGYLVTFWGDIAHDCICPNCDTAFSVREYVTRSYEVIKDDPNG